MSYGGTQDFQPTLPPEILFDISRDFVIIYMVIQFDKTVGKVGFPFVGRTFLPLIEGKKVLAPVAQVDRASVS